MNAFLATCATFAFGLGVTSTLGYVLEHQQLALHPIDQNADVRGGIIAVTKTGYPILETKPARIDVSEPPGATSQEI